MPANLWHTPISVLSSSDSRQIARYLSIYRSLWSAPHMSFSLNVEKYR